MPKFIAMNDESDAVKVLLEQNNAHVMVKVDGVAVAKFNAKTMEFEVFPTNMTPKGLTLRVVEPVLGPIPGAAPAPPAPAPTPTPTPMG